MKLGKCLTKITDINKLYLEKVIDKGDIVVDATMGNGYDTLFLCRLAEENGQVIAFDIQEKALEATRKLLAKEGMEERARLVLDSHVNMGKYVQEDSVDGICFNFGYLPGGDHALATQPETSKKALKVGLELLKKGGVMSLCIYSGGDTGFEEKEVLMNYIKELDERKYVVIVSSYYNRKNNPPIPVLIIKK